MNESNSNELVSQEVLVHLESLVESLGIVNRTIAVTEGSIRGDNYLGIIAKATVDGYDNKTKEKVSLNFIIKSAPRQGVVRDLGPVRNAYEREIFVYSKLLPEFVQLQKEKGIKNPFKSYAKYYGSTLDDMNEALVMEDMKSLGFCMWDRHVPLNYDHVLFVMREYGKLHALSYALREHKPNVFEKLAEQMNENVFQRWNENDDVAKAMKKQNGERILSAFDPVDEKIVYARLEEFNDTIFEHFNVLFKREAAGNYAVFGHGDNWINNMLFNYQDPKNPQKPTQLCLLDWQLSRAGSPALDLSYFLFTSTDKILRDKHYDHLIKEYHDSLSTFLYELGCDAERILPYDVLQDQLKRFSCFGLYMSMMVLYFMMSDTDEIPDLHNANYKNNECLDNFNFKTKNVEKYNERLRDIVFDFIKFKYDF